MAVKSSVNVAIYLKNVRRECERVLEKIIAAFIVGMVAGIGLHRLLMAMILERSPDDICAYCEWLERKKENRHMK